MKYLVVFLVLIGTVVFVAPQAFSEPVSREEFIKTYQPKLDRVQNENLPPVKQSMIGIHFNDIFCHDNKVHVLKLTGENYIACVSPDSAVKLVERGWGLVHREDPHSGQKGSECNNWWIIRHSDDGITSKSKLIKTIRETTNAFSDEFVVWMPVRLVEQSDNTLTVSSYGNFDDIYLDMILDNLSKIEHVLDVEHKPRACI